jgi:hypothetical protein
MLAGPMDTLRPVATGHGKKVELSQKGNEAKKKLEKHRPDVSQQGKKNDQWRGRTADLSLTQQCGSILQLMMLTDIRRML